ncbi:MAG: UDP-N-acetylmuramoyl-tripeptide--D-alanyl-D-alanine ligase [Candidatus Berkelbacteria bacterium]|nr:UDP-N-acetylmuramoyl-tripeptide--D-alanyl-D-alanine ligase [Candidatus Berkelbacteria bacterium]
MKKYLSSMFQSIIVGLASRVIKKKKPKIIIVTGSVAKSSTKEAIFYVLAEKFGSKGVRRSTGSLNTKTGVPLSILGFKQSVRWYIAPFVVILAFFKSILFTLSLLPFPKILILEMGIDLPGDFKSILSYVKPTVGVITAIGPSHLEFFHTLPKVIEEKVQVVEVLPEKGFAVLNRKDPLVPQVAHSIKANIKYFDPEPNISTAVARLVGEIFELSDEQINRGLKKTRSLIGRLNLIRGKSKSLIIDDSYNANPLSMEYALRELNFLKEQNLAKRRIAILGDMLELGGYTKKAHEDVGKMAQSKCDLLLCTGEGGKVIARVGKGKYFKTKSDLIKYIKQEIKEGDIILVKASRGMKFEDIVKEIKK